MGKQFRNRRVSKVYQALVWGDPQGDSGMIETGLGPDPGSKLLQRVYPLNDPRGKLAKSGWRVVERFQHFSLVEVELFTGRTHQIRVHMRHLGHSILGDHHYGGLRGDALRFPDQEDWLPPLFEIMPRQALHAGQLSLYHPRTEEYLTFKAALPVDFQALINHLRQTQ